MNRTALRPESIPLSLYIHWPWCVRKCPYCDFNSRAAPSCVPEERYIAAVLSDLERQVPLAAGRALQSVYIGGGTPSLMSEAGMERLLSGVFSKFSAAPDCEVSMEANPGTVTEARFRSYKASGISRVSIGVQSLSDASLQALGRIHDRKAAVEAAEAAGRVFDNFNLDLMFGLPGETAESLRADIREAASLGSTHFSCYQLTLEEGTAFAKNPPAGLPDEDLLGDMTDIAVSELAAQGFRRYEVSGYAKPGFECRHNLNYWTYGDYLAAGAGAHGKATDSGGVFRFAFPEAPLRYMEGSEKGLPPAEKRRIASEDLAFEFMLDGLRLLSGVRISDFENRTGLSYSCIEQQVRQAESEGLLSAASGIIRPTSRGMDFLSDLQALFLPESFSE